MLAADYPFLDMIWTMAILFLWILWIWLLFSVFADIFRRDDLSGWAKAGWIFGLIILPWISILLYFCFRPRETPPGNRALHSANRLRPAAAR